MMGTQSLGQSSAQSLPRQDQNTSSKKQLSYKTAVTGSGLESKNAVEQYKRNLKAKAEQENSTLWQHPFVDVFKHFKLLPGNDYKLNKKNGSVEEYFVSVPFHSLTIELLYIGQGNRQESCADRGNHLSQ